MFTCNMEIIPAFNVATFNWTYMHSVYWENSGFVGNIEEHISAIEKYDC